MHGCRHHRGKSQGTDYAHAHYYGAWWFILIWAVLAALGAFYIIKRKVKCASTLALHLSFIIILAGALLTHISAKRGMIHLRIGQPTDTYMAQDEEQGMQEEKLPFSLCLQKFEAKMHDGTNAVADYSSKFTVIDGDDKSEGEVSMNNIYSHPIFTVFISHLTMKTAREACSLSMPIHTAYQSPILAMRCSSSPSYGCSSTLRAVIANY